MVLEKTSVSKEASGMKWINQGVQEVFFELSQWVLDMGCLGMSTK